MRFWLLHLSATAQHASVDPALPEPPAADSKLHCPALTQRLGCTVVMCVRICDHFVQSTADSHRQSQCWPSLQGPAPASRQLRSLAALLLLLPAAARTCWCSRAAADSSGNSSKTHGHARAHMHRHTD